jgi:hypothetical protein
MRGIALRIRPLAATLAASAALLLGTAAAQYASDPFFEQTVVQSRGFGLEMMGVRLLLLDAYGVAPEELDETVEGLEEDLARFGGTLAAAAPDVAEALEEALEALEEAFENGEDLTARIAEIRELHEAAYAIVVPAEVRASPAFRAGVTADLLLAEGGVAEGVEEAVEEGEPWMYPLGWAALQRVEELWSGLAEFATAAQDSFAQQYFDTLREIYPTATIPDTLPSNPEEAESPAQSLVGILESVADAALYPGRDVRRLAPHLVTVTAPACDAYAAGHDAVAFEHIVVVGDLYTAHLADFLGLVAGEVNEDVTGMLASLGYAGEDDDDEADEGGEEGEDEDDAELADDPAAACGALLEALEEASAVLGG